jgi:Uma2 family endonuclease
VLIAIKTYTHAVDYLDVIAQLPPGSRLLLYDVDWDDYDRLLAQIEDSSHFRISYGRGRMEIMSPSAKHEKYKNLLHDLILILSDELNLEVLSYGSTTLKLKVAGKGAEADDCFYIQHAADVAEKEDLDLTRDPPPDLVVEIDLTHESTTKLGIYSALRVPEIWRFDGATCHIIHLEGQQYREVHCRLAFPFLEAQHLSEFIASSARSGPRQARYELRNWLKSKS